MSERRDSNPRPPPPHDGALPTAPRSELSCILLQSNPNFNNHGNFLDNSAHNCRLRCRNNYRFRNFNRHGSHSPFFLPPSRNPSFGRNNPLVRRPLENVFVQTRNKLENTSFLWNTGNFNRNFGSLSGF